MAPGFAKKSEEQGWLSKSERNSHFPTWSLYAKCDFIYMPVMVQKWIRMTENFIHDSGCHSGGAERVSGMVQKTSTLPVIFYLLY